MIAYTYFAYKLELSDMQISNGLDSMSENSFNLFIRDPLEYPFVEVVRTLEIFLSTCLVVPHSSFTNHGYLLRGFMFIFYLYLTP